ncbi:hypothetical protein DXA83_23660 [Bacteroides thetaiotaomicron]|nr:hypothetical protein DXA83_23660 [Bacteroides thetaiotaomicron]
MLLLCFFIFILSCLKGGKWWGNKGEKGIFITFFNFTYSKISQKTGFIVSPFRLLFLEEGKEDKIITTIISLDSIFTKIKTTYYVT